MSTKILSEGEVRPLTNNVAADLYLDLLKRSLVNWHYAHQVTHEVPAWSWKRRMLKEQLARFGISARIRAPIPDEMLLEGKGICTDAYTMVGLKRLDNVEYCVRDVLANGVAGDLLEAGVWRGGTSIFMRGILMVHGVHDRKVWVADSFRGLPPPDLERYPQDARETLHENADLAVPLDQVRANFERYGLLDDQVEFLEGYFRDTLDDPRIEKLSVLRMDGDMYESTMDTLVALYPKLSSGGYVIIDDYARENCAQAVADYRGKFGIDAEIEWVDWTGAFWRKP